MKRGRRKKGGNRSNGEIEEKNDEDLRELEARRGRIGGVKRRRRRKADERREKRREEKREGCRVTRAGGDSR